MSFCAVGLVYRAGGMEIRLCCSVLLVCVVGQEGWI